MRHSHPSLPRPGRKIQHIHTPGVMDTAQLVARLRKQRVPEADITRAVEVQRNKRAFARDGADVITARVTRQGITVLPTRPTR